MRRLFNELRGRRRLLVAGGAAFVLSLAGTALGLLPSVTVTLESGMPPASEAARRSYGDSLRSGRELLLVYIGASTCVWSNDKSFPQLVDTVRARVSAAARASGRSFATLGVARDWDVAAGVRHLARVGRFDEIIVGGSWLNSGLLKYVWKDFPGAPATPQILVVDRVIRTRRDAETGSPYDVEEEQLITRRVGLGEIRQWSSNGATLPTLAAAKQE